MSAMKNVPMFDKPEEQPLALSKALAGFEYRLAEGEAAKWAAASFKTYRPCQECSVLQHETKGQFGPRRQVKKRRRHPMGPTLELCSGHAALWHTRDEEDSAPSKASARAS